MQRVVYFDSGTTNSRAYYIENGNIKRTMQKEVGTVDNLTSHNPQTLTNGLKAMYDKLLVEENITDQAINEVYMSGMATSKHGVKEIPFLLVPIDLTGYKKGIVKTKVAKFGRDISFLTGIVDGRGEANLNTIQKFHNVRGEETELFGIMAMYPDYFTNKCTAVIMPGSHTHILYVKNGLIVELTSCMGGEFYKAMSKHTILCSSVSERPELLEEAGLKKGYEAVTQYGINRALYMTRTLELFSQESALTRDSYLEGVVHSDIINVLKNNKRSKELDYVMVAGTAIYDKIFRTLWEVIDTKVPFIWGAPNEHISFALAGLREITRGGSNED